MKNARGLLSILLVLVLLTGVFPAFSMAALAADPPAYTVGAQLSNLVGKIEVSYLSADKKTYLVTLLLDAPIMVSIEGEGGVAQVREIAKLALKAPPKHNKKRATVSGTLISSASMSVPNPSEMPCALDPASVVPFPAAKSVSIADKVKTLNVLTSHQLGATVKPATAEQFVSWSSSKASVASVDATGKLTALAKGSTTITAKARNGKKAAFKLKVVVPASGVSLDKTSLSLAKGKSATLKAAVAPADASNKGVKWASSDKKVATVNKKGKVSAKNAGSATITVTTKDGGFVAACAVTVAASGGGGGTEVTYVSFDDPYSIEMVVGQTRKLTATVTPATATNKKLTWSSDTPAVVSVDQNGLLTAHRAGAANIFATAANGVKNNRYVTVVNDAAKPEYISFDVPGAELIAGTRSQQVLYGAASVQLKLNASPSTATPPAVTWSSSNTAVASVSSSGLLTVNGSGMTYIKADAGIPDRDGDNMEHEILLLVGASKPARLAADDMKVTIEGKTLTMPATKAQVKAQLPMWYEQTTSTSTYWSNSLKPFEGSRTTFCFALDGTMYWMYSMDGKAVTNRGIKVGSSAGELVDMYGAPDEDIDTYSSSSFTRFEYWGNDASGCDCRLDFVVDNATGKVTEICYTNDSGDDD